MRLHVCVLRVFYGLGLSRQIQFRLVQLCFVKVKEKLKFLSWTLSVHFYPFSGIRPYFLPDTALSCIVYCSYLSLSLQLGL